MIDIRCLEFRYPDTDFCLRMSAFAVAPAEKIAVIGPSGSGKTTLLNLFAGILTPQRGRLHIDGTQVNALSDTERRDFRITHIGFVFQDFALIDYLDVLDNILHPYRITKALTLDTQVRSQAERLAKAMGLKDKLQRYPGALSQGEKQRVAICRALLPKPKLVLADEATGNLDPTNKFLILDLLFQSVAEQHATLIAVTHDHELLSRFDRVVDFRDFSRDFHAEAAA